MISAIYLFSIFISLARKPDGWWCGQSGGGIERIFQLFVKFSHFIWHVREKWEIVCFSIQFRFLIKPTQILTILHARAIRMSKVFPRSFSAICNNFSASYFFLSSHHRAPNESVVFTVFTIFWIFFSSSNASSWNCVNNLILRIIWSNSTRRTRGRWGWKTKTMREKSHSFSFTYSGCAATCSSQMCSHFTTFHNYWQSKSSIGTNFLFLFVYSITFHSLFLFLFFLAIFFLWLFSLADFPQTFPHFRSYTHFISIVNFFVVVDLHDWTAQFIEETSSGKNLTPLPGYACGSLSSLSETEENLNQIFGFSTCTARRAHKKWKSLTEKFCFCVSRELLSCLLCGCSRSHPIEVVETHTSEPHEDRDFPLLSCGSTSLLSREWERSHTWKIALLWRLGTSRIHESWSINGKQRTQRDFKREKKISKFSALLSRDLMMMVCDSFGW